MLSLVLTAELEGSPHRATIFDAGCVGGLNSALALRIVDNILHLTISGSVTSLRPIDTEEDPYYYTFRVKCTSCHEIHPNWVGFNRFEEHEIPGSRGEANFVWKCRLCTKTHSASIISGPNTYELQEKKTGQKIIEMDCRGLEFIEFKPAEGKWEAKGVESPTTFSDIELDEGEWYDYDEKTSEEVSIKDITWSVGRA
ncbi:hypothetical protein N7533_004510 [Penicillium manginii]|uniref:uncharacterized protein n=1 Tax=Penicillium manginii TaxID=203109 RepID=UPI002548E453|nr:uncharacterized protein N7533_004510 [Penicillium manginii]KAJ5754967.1 hypothetical protein N7533_004510 [Penicillium manginii]